VKLAVAALEASGYTPEFMESGGGADANVFNAAGTALASNDDWGTPVGTGAATAAQLSAAFTQVGAFALQVRRDSAMIITLRPGSYTAKVSGFQGATGVGLVEIYEMP